MFIMRFLLVSVDYEAKKPAELTVEDKRAAIKQLIERIPTDKLELFAWPLDWDQVDKVIITLQSALTVIHHNC